MDELVIGLFTKYPVLSVVLSCCIAAHALAVFVVNLTPTPKDDAYLAKFYKWVEWVAGIVSPKSKDKGGEK